MSRLREILWILSMPCTQATRLISESLDRELPLRLRIAIRVHQLSCSGCRRYRRQIEALRAALARRLRNGAGLPSEEAAGLSPEARQRIKTVLRDAPRE